MLGSGRTTAASPVPDAGGIRLIAAGKAAPAMAAAAARIFGTRIRAGLVISAQPSIPPAGFEAIASGHPLPTPASEAAGRQALALAGATRPDETLVVLISGARRP